MLPLTPFMRRIFLYNFSFFFGTLMVAFGLIPLKALLPTDLAVSLFVLIVIDFNFLQLINACLPIFLTVDGITTFLSFLLFLKALAATEVT